MAGYPSGKQSRQRGSGITQKQLPVLGRSLVRPRNLTLVGHFLIMILYSKSIISFLLYRLTIEMVEIF